MYTNLIQPSLLLLLLSLPGASPSLPLPARPAEPDKSAAAAGSVVGTVKDAAGSVLQGAQIVLQPTATSAASDALGNFVIPNVAPGAYTVTVSYVGFAASQASVAVAPGQSAMVVVTMAVASSNQQVLVNANLAGDAVAINEQRTSANILDVQTDAQIQSLPNQNVADAIGRMPGVTLQRNEGEGSMCRFAASSLG